MLHACGDCWSKLRDSIVEVGAGYCTGGGSAWGRGGYVNAVVSVRSYDSTGAGDAVGSVTLTVKLYAPPANDNFAARTAVALTGSGSIRRAFVSGSLVAATGVTCLWL